MIGFQFFNGCPNADSTLENLKAVMMELCITDDHLKITEVPNMESAEKLHFQGSPSILVNGKDIYTGEVPTAFSYACRIYDFDGERTGEIPLDFVWKKLADYR